MKKKMSLFGGLKAYDRLQHLKEPNWQKPKYPKIDYQNLYYYSAPKSTKDKPKSNYPSNHLKKIIYVGCK